MNPVLYWYSFKFWFSIVFVIALFIWADYAEIKGQHLIAIHLFGIVLVCKKLFDKFIDG